MASYVFVSSLCLRRCPFEVRTLYQILDYLESENVLVQRPYLSRLLGVLHATRSYSRYANRLHSPNPICRMSLWISRTYSLFSNPLSKDLNMLVLRSRRGESNALDIRWANDNSETLQKNFRVGSCSIHVTQMRHRFRHTRREMCFREKTCWRIDVAPHHRSTVNFKNNEK